MDYKKLVNGSKSAIVLLMLLACSELPEYDLVVLNAKVLSFDSEKFSDVNIGISNGKIAEMSLSELKGAHYVDAKGQFVYPAFIDAHCHFVGYASGLQQVNLVGTRSLIEVIDRLKTFEKEHPELDFIVGRGWDQNDWAEKSFPNNELLSAAFPSKAVYLTRIDGHALLLNKKALEIVGTLPDWIDGGEIIRENGLPTGVLIDEAMSLVRIPELSKKLRTAGLQLAEANCFSLGLTGLADAGLAFGSILFLDSLQRAGVLKMPVYAMLSDSEDDNAQLFADGYFTSELIKVKSIKVYFDGALGSRGALLLQPYSDHPGHFGLQIKHREDLKNLCVEAKKKGIQINVHAIGDSANRVVLQVFAEVLGGKNNLRWRVEHAQIVNPADSGYFINYSILPSVQPTHATSDMYWAEERLGKTRINHAYAYQDLLRWSGGHMPLGTDFPVEDIDPRKTFYAAVTRQDAAGFPAGGFLPQQKLTRIEALKGMTIEAAYAQFEENETGSIEPGKWANLFFSPTNLLACTEQEILNTKITRTIVRGKTVYELK